MRNAMANVEDYIVRRRRMKFHVRDWGGRGVPLILLHGLASNAHIFDAVAPLLAKHFRVVAIDQRGHGASAKPDTGYDFRNVTADLSAITDAFKFRRAIIVGHSWGGNVALQFGAQYPGQTAALVLVDGGFIDLRANPRMTWERTEVELAPPRLAGTPLEEFREMLHEHLGALATPVFMDAILANFEILPDQTIRPHLSYEHHMEILRALWEQRPGEYYKLIQCPVLLVPARMPVKNEIEQSALDRKRASVQAAEQGLATTETVWFDETVHDIPLHRPRKLANAIIHLARHYKLLATAPTSAPKH